MLSIAVLAPSADCAARVCQTLERLGHRCESFGDLQALVDAVEDRPLGLVLMHGALGPHGAGLQAIRRVRAAAGPSLPVIVAADAKADEVAALEAGADAWLPPSASAALLQARVQAMLRRRVDELSPVPGDLVCGPYRFDRRGRQVALRGVVVPLRLREYKLALLLFQNLGRSLSRERIVEALWPRAVSVTSRTVDNHIRRLRSRLQLSGANAYVLDTVYGIGYRLAAVHERDDSLPVAR